MPHTNRDATKELRSKTFSPSDNKYWRQEVDYVVKHGDEKQMRCHTWKLKGAKHRNTFDFAPVAAAMGLPGCAPMEVDNDNDKGRYPARAHKPP